MPSVACLPEGFSWPPGHRGGYGGGDQLETCWKRSVGLSSGGYSRTASSGHRCLAPSGHQQVALGTQWPHCSRKGELKTCVWESLGQEAGREAHFHQPPSRSLVLGTLGREGPEAPNWVPWFQTVGGLFCGQWTGTQDVLHVPILTSDGVKARGWVGGCSGPTGMRQPGLCRAKSAELRIPWEAVWFLEPFSPPFFYLPLSPSLHFPSPLSPFPLSLLSAPP